MSYPALGDTLQLVTTDLYLEVHGNRIPKATEHLQVRTAKACPELQKGLSHDAA